MEAREATATGESCMRVDAIAKVTGRARYADFILTDMSAAYISFKMLRKGVMSIADLFKVSTPSF